MEVKSFGTVKLIIFSSDVTKDELASTANVMQSWSEENREIAVVTHIPKDGKAVQDMTTISKMFSILKGSQLKIYGIRSGAITSFVAKIVGQLLNITLIEEENFIKLTERMSRDNPDFARDIEEYDLVGVLQALD